MAAPSVSSTPFGRTERSPSRGTTGVYSKTENRALTDDDLYGIGSISKTYTAAAMMKLVEQGKVDLDEPVTAYLPDFTMADPRYTQITVRMLLNHSSGLMGGTTNDAFLFGDQGNDDAPSRLLERLAGQTLQAEPALTASTPTTASPWPSWSSSGSAAWSTPPF